MMSGKIMVGPLLGIESETRYTVCFLTSDKIEVPVVQVDDERLQAKCIANIKNHCFWRVSIEIEAPQGGSGKFVSYSVLCGGGSLEDRAGNTQWKFYVPGEREAPRVAYASCNGAAESGKLGSLEEAYDLWNRMLVKHEECPYSILLMGGDQVYCDSIWNDVKELNSWPKLSREEKLKKSASKKLLKELDDFYLSTIYKTRWSDFRMMKIFASIPSIMMWDDHDIFDGWGSFPSDLQSSDIYQAIYKYARKYFELFQVRGKENSALISSDRTHFSQMVSFRGCCIIAMDNRSERSIDQVMSDKHWRELKAVINKCPDDSDLYVMSAVPVIYRDFSGVEKAMEMSSWQESLEDDILDHWKARRHQGERKKLIMNLLFDARRRAGKRTLILSGDVHVGCMGVVSDKTQRTPVRIHQIVSSGIVHPPPSWIAWNGIMLVTNDDVESLNEDGTITAKMVKTVGGDEYIRVQNFASIEPGDDGNLWVAWECKNGERPLYAVS